MTTPIQPPPIKLPLYFDPAEIFIEKTQVIIRIKRIMLERRITHERGAKMLCLDEKEFRKILVGDYTSYPLAYLRTLHSRIQGEA